MKLELRGLILVIALSILLILQLSWFLFIAVGKTAVTFYDDDPNGVQQITIKANVREISSFNETQYIMGEPKLTDPYKRNSFNLTASDRTPSDRHIPDTRHPLCLDQVYSKSLPSTSVIICFHNEARSTLLRTVISVLNRSPPSLIHEIILVDDFSDDPNDGILLEALPKVKVLRNNAREGLVRSRITGADYATAPVLTFLDSHCECNVGWLEPLLQRVMEDKNVVVSPVIEIIDFNKFVYVKISAKQRGGFDWTLTFKWDSKIDPNRKTEVAPIKTPTIAGGLFSINRQRFIDIGKYDEGMDIWGGENLEISFRTWMCGGSMEIIPCSKVGHVFRRTHPYKFPDGSSKTCTKNSKRTAIVWMDEYKKLYYSVRPSAKEMDVGNVDKRLALRKKLNCTSFNWYMKNIYPEMDIQDIGNAQVGRIEQQGDCMDLLKSGSGTKVGLRTCHNYGGDQAWTITTRGSIQNAEDYCLQNVQGKVTIRKCSIESKEQLWEMRIDVKTVIRSMSTGECISSSTGKQELILEQCHGSHDNHQIWNTSLFHKIIS